MSARAVATSVAVAPHALGDCENHQPQVGYDP